MTLEKYLERAQSSLEYFLLFGVTIAVTLVTVSAFLPRVQSSLQGNTTRASLFERGASRLGMAGGNVTFSTSPEATDGTGSGSRAACLAACNRISSLLERIRCILGCPAN